jgi:dienelactone hydrolase
MWTQASNEFGFIATALKSPGNSWSLSQGDLANQLIDDVSSKWNIDMNRIYLVGFSAGGAFNVGYCTTPESLKVAAMALFCSPCNPGWYWKGKEATRKVPVYIASNTGDANFNPCKQWDSLFTKNGHKTQFVDESERVNGGCHSTL